MSNMTTAEGVFEAMKQKIEARPKAVNIPSGNTHQLTPIRLI